MKQAMSSAMILNHNESSGIFSLSFSSGLNIKLPKQLLEKLQLVLREKFGGNSSKTLDHQQLLDVLFCEVDLCCVDESLDLAKAIHDTFFNFMEKFVQNQELTEHNVRTILEYHGRVISVYNFLYSGFRTLGEDWHAEQIEQLQHSISSRMGYLYDSMVLLDWQTIMEEEQFKSKRLIHGFILLISMSILMVIYALGMMSYLSIVKWGLIGLSAVMLTLLVSDQLGYNKRKISTEAIHLDLKFRYLKREVAIRAGISNMD